MPQEPKRKRWWLAGNAAVQLSALYNTRAHVVVICVLSADTAVLLSERGHLHSHGSSSYWQKSDGSFRGTAQDGWRRDVCDVICGAGDGDSRCWRWLRAVIRPVSRSIFNGTSAIYVGVACRTRATAGEREAD